METVGPLTGDLPREMVAVEVITGSFEDWAPEGDVFDAVVAVNSLHWVDSALRYAKPAQPLSGPGIPA